MIISLGPSMCSKDCPPLGLLVLLLHCRYVLEIIPVLYHVVLGGIAFLLPVSGIEKIIP